MRLGHVLKQKGKEKSRRELIPVKVKVQLRIYQQKEQQTFI